jgi:hypothetical protein
MAIGTGQTHWQAGHVGAEGTPYDEVPLQVQNARFAYERLIDFDTTSEAAYFSLTQVGAAGTFSNTNEPAGVARLASGAADNTGVGSLQFDNGVAGTGISVLLPSTANSLSGLDNRIISCGARFNVNDYSVSDWFFGLAGIDITLLLTTGLLAATGCDNCVGWHHCGEAVTQGGLTGADGNDVRLVSAGTAVANMVATRLSAANVPMPAPTDAAIDGIFVEYVVKIIGTRNVEWYRNGILRHRALLAAAAPLAAVVLTPSFAHLTAGGGGAVNMDIDYVWSAATR